MKLINKIRNLFLDWPLFYCSLICILGFIISTTTEKNVLPIYFLLICIFSAFALLTRNNQLMIFGITFFAILILADIFTQIKTPDLNHESETFIAIESQVVSIPKKTKGGYSAVVMNDSKLGKKRYRIFYKNLNLDYGSLIKVSGESPGYNNNFPTREYLLVNHIDRVIFANKIEVLGTQKSNKNMVLHLYDLRSSVIELSEKIFLPDSAGIINAMIFGDTKLIDADTENIFLRTGTTHLLVVSGANVLLIAWIVKNLFISFGIKIARILSLLTIIAFIIFTGAEPSIIRAGLIFILITFAETIGRKPHYPTLLAFTALIMAISNPWILIYNISFQLSFGAVIGLILFEKKIKSLLSVSLFKETLAPTLATSIFTIPLILLYFGQLSVIFVIANILVLPLVPLITILGIMALTLSFLPALAWTVSGLVVILLKILSVISLSKLSLITFDNKILAFTIMMVALTPIMISLSRHQIKK